MKLRGRIPSGTDGIRIPGGSFEANARQTHREDFSVAEAGTNSAWANKGQG
jgi:hypothetical protein